MRHSSLSGFGLFLSDCDHFGHHFAFFDDFLDLSVLDHEDAVDEAQVVGEVGGQDDRLALQVLCQRLLEDEGADRGVEGAEDVVQDVDVRLLVEGPCQGDPRPLPARKRRPVFPDHCLVAVGEEVEVGFEAGEVQGPAVALLLVSLPEQDVVLDAVVEDPRILVGVGDGAVDGQAGGVVVHLAEDRVEDGGLARAVLADQGNELALLDCEADVLQAEAHLLDDFVALSFLFPVETAASHRNGYLCLAGEAPADVGTVPLLVDQILLDLAQRYVDVFEIVSLDHELVHVHAVVEEHDRENEGRVDRIAVQRVDQDKDEDAHPGG